MTTSELHLLVLMGGWGGAHICQQISAQIQKQSNLELVCVTMAVMTSAVLKMIE